MLLSTLDVHFSTARAQGTAFTYQGQLQNNGSLASGSYNLTFTLFTTHTGDSAVAGPVTNNATIIAGIYGNTVSGSGTPVYINNGGRLGTATSSQRFKEHINNRAAASEAIYSLRPVTFQYKPEIDPAGTPQFGLVAEVAQANPDLVVRDARNQVYSVRYEAVNAMLLNEFLKEHRTVVERQAELETLKQSLAALEKIVLNLESN
jgi:hypothetical protein